MAENKLSTLDRPEMRGRDEMSVVSSRVVRDLHWVIVDQYDTLKKKIEYIKNAMTIGLRSNQLADEQFREMTNELHRSYLLTQSQPQIYERTFNAVGSEVQIFLDHTILEVDREDPSIPGWTVSQICVRNRLKV